MSELTVRFDSSSVPANVPAGTLLVDAASMVGVDVQQPCGGQGRCGRCAVRVTSGNVRRRSTLRLSGDDLDAGYALACQTVVEGDVTIEIPPPEQIERRLTTVHAAPEAVVPAGYDASLLQSVRRVELELTAPSLDDQTDDWARFTTGLRTAAGIEQLDATLDQIQRLGAVLRRTDWRVAAVFEETDSQRARLIDVRPLAGSGDLWGLAIDIGTTTVTVWLVDLTTGRVERQASEYNRQVMKGEDIISRIIYSSRGEGAGELRSLVLATINELVERLCGRADISAESVVKAVVSGNSTMMHLLLGIPAESIRLQPFVTAINHPPSLVAAEVGISMHPDGVVDLLPGVAGYVGADISAGVLAAGLRDSEETTLFIDIGTNGEMVLGSTDWLVTCACSAGPAFEGAGVEHGMRADTGAIEEVWIDQATYEPSCRVIGGSEPRGICGSGLIALIAEMFLTGILDKAGHFNAQLPTDRIRPGDHGLEYVIFRGEETEHGRDIVVTTVDVDNLIRAKAAIFAGFNVLADRVGMPLTAVDRVLVGGAFGKYINVEKAIDIGLLPDMDWDRFDFLGNTSVMGAYLALIDPAARDQIADIASHMTYIELSADNSFYDAFTSALFLPHTDMSRFPSVAEALA